MDKDKAENDEKELYYELAYYTLSHLDQKFFIHQYLVDAFAAQTAREDSKAIGLYFALAGLYLHLEKGYSGREVQLAHIQMAKNKDKVGEWPTFSLPLDRGSINISDVLKVSPGPLRDQAIKDWSASVWKAFSKEHEKVKQILEVNIGI
jgi:hypothetical protein